MILMVNSWGFYWEIDGDSMEFVVGFHGTVGFHRATLVCGCFFGGCIEDDYAVYEPRNKTEGGPPYVVISQKCNSMACEYLKGSV